MLSDLERAELHEHLALSTFRLAEALRAQWPVSRAADFAVEV